MKWILPALALSFAGCHHSGEQPAPPAQPAPTLPPPAIVEETWNLPGKFFEITGITDAHTLTARVDGKQVKVRMEGIDAPEKAQPGGKASTAPCGRS